MLYTGWNSAQEGSLHPLTHTIDQIDVGEQAFNPNTLVDILVQMNSHSKRCAQDIQDYQRLLAVKMKSLDDYTVSAVQELGSIHQRAKVNSDQLLSGMPTVFTCIYQCGL